MYIRPNIITTRGMYHKDITTIKTIGTQYKCTWMASLRKAGIEVVQDRTAWAVNETKLDNNISRAKTKIMEYALCNPWDWFVSLTLNDEWDRHNLSVWHKDITKFFANYNRYCEEKEKVTYVLIPEQHQDGAWHMHGLIKGIRAQDIYRNEHGYMSWRQYDAKYGYMSMGRIKSNIRVARYITKYVSKTLAADVTALGAHLYYCSRGLQVGEVIFRGHATCDMWQWEHPDGYMMISTYNSLEEMSKHIQIIDNI